MRIFLERALNSKQIKVGGFGPYPELSVACSELPWTRHLNFRWWPGNTPEFRCSYSVIPWEEWSRSVPPFSSQTCSMEWCLSVRYSYLLVIHFFQDGWTLGSHGRGFTTVLPLQFYSFTCCPCGFFLSKNLDKYYLRNSGLFFTAFRLRRQLTREHCCCSSSCS